VVEYSQRAADPRFSAHFSGEQDAVSYPIHSSWCARAVWQQSWKQQRDAEPRKILITNRTYWEVHRILKTYRKRWTGTETFHRDGKQHLGMGECQLRSGESQTKHMYLVFLAYSALMRQLQHNRAQEWGHARLRTIGESCRAMFRETMGKTIAWVVEQVQQGESLSAIKARLALP
jgi:hypothetical protein